MVISSKTAVAASLSPQYPKAQLPTDLEVLLQQGKQRRNLTDRATRARHDLIMQHLKDTVAGDLKPACLLDYIQWPHSLPETPQSAEIALTIHLPGLCPIDVSYVRQPGAGWLRLGYPLPNDPHRDGWWYVREDGWYADLADALAAAEYRAALQDETPTVILPRDPWERFKAAFREVMEVHTSNLAMGC